MLTSAYVRILTCARTARGRPRPARLRGYEIDLYHVSRPPTDVGIEETIGAVGDLVSAGKVRHLGVPELDAQRVRRVHAVHPVAVMQSEHSLRTRDVEEVVPVGASAAVAWHWQPASGWSAHLPADVDAGRFLPMSGFRQVVWQVAAGGPVAGAALGVPEADWLGRRLELVFRHREPS